jgi:aspartate racemase
VFDELRARASIPMVSIVEAACESAHERGLRRVGLFGTKFTMNGEFYPRVFSSRGIEVVAPDPEERAYVHEKYVNELIPGIFLTETRERLLEIAARMRERDHVEAIVLGGTELPLILKDAPSSGPALLDTTKIHVEKIVREMLGPRDGR